MKAHGLVIFDGDDTLWRVEELYDAALMEAVRLLDAAGLPGAEWRLRQREYDLRNVRKLGMSPERFPLSSRQALLAIGQKHTREVPTQLLGEVEVISWSVFTRKAPVMRAAREVLDALKPAFRLALLTKGDPLVQARRVQESGLSSWFETVQIVAEKNETVFKQIVSDFDVRPERAWSVGNSLASDVNPALRAGLHAIWIDAHVWEHERREVDAAHGRVVVLEGLEQLPQVLLPAAEAQPEV